MVKMINLVTETIINLVTEGTDGKEGKVGDKDYGQ